MILVVAAVIEIDTTSSAMHFESKSLARPEHHATLIGLFCYIVKLALVSLTSLCLRFLCSNVEPTIIFIVRLMAFGYLTDLLVDHRADRIQLIVYSGCAHQFRSALIIGHGELSVRLSVDNMIVA